MHRSEPQHLLEPLDSVCTGTQARSFEVVVSWCNDFSHLAHPRKTAGGHSQPVHETAKLSLSDRFCQTIEDQQASYTRHGP